MSEQLMRIGELAAHAGVSVRTVDFYTNLDLLRPRGRTHGGFRLFHPDDAQRIAAIQRLEAHGMRLQEIANALIMPGPHHGGVTHEPSPDQDETSGDLSTVLNTLERDLRALRAAVEGAEPQARALVGGLSARAQGLIATALVLATDLHHLMPLT